MRKPLHEHRLIFPVRRRLKQIPEWNKQVIKFTFIGMLAVLTDLAVYYILLNTLPVKVFNLIDIEAFAKTVSFICGLFVTYNFNKLWTWRKRDSSKKRFAKFMALYGSSLVLNVGANMFLLHLLHNNALLMKLPGKYLIAFIGATGMSAAYNFAGQKFWVFTART